MRQYVICNSPFPDVGPHIIAEVVSDGLEDDPQNGLAAGLAGERALIVTRSQLKADPLWRMALEAWDARDDSEFDRETQAILADDSDPYTTPLRVVDGSEPPKRAPIRIPTDASRRELILRARALRIWSRDLVQEARTFRQGFLAAQAGSHGKERPILEVVTNE